MFFFFFFKINFIDFFSCDKFYFLINLHSQRNFLTELYGKPKLLAENNMKADIIGHILF